MFDDDVVQEYLAECREHLSGIESDLLQMEQDGSEIDDNRVNKVFRAAHSIKGGAGFFNFNKIRDLAHRTENVLDLIRSRRAVPSPEVVNVLLLAFDKLRDMIGNPAASEQSDISDFVRGLQELTASGLAAESKHSVDETISISRTGRPAGVRMTGFDFDTACKSGKSVYLVEFDLLHDIQRKGKNPLEVLKKLMQYGALLDTAFDLASAGTLDQDPSNELLLDVLYGTCLEPDLIASVAEVPESRIFKIDRSGSSHVAASGTPGGTCASAEHFDGGETLSPPGPLQSSATPAKARPSRKAKKGGNSSVRPAGPSVTRRSPSKRNDALAPDPLAPEPGLAAATPAPLPDAAATVVTETQAPAASMPGTGPQAGGAADSTVRLHVSLLDSLMNLAGELVLCRNQLSDAVARGDEAMVQAASQSIGVVTSDVQQAVMRTRMQPVGNLFQKFTRFVRDTGRKLNKDVRLVMEANDVELDKTIIEGLSDPLSHMVRNAIDHGIETPSARAAAGKPEEGTVFLRAWHEAGLVVVEIADDGKGLDPEKLAAGAVAKGLISADAAGTMTAEEKVDLILLPGFSTAERISDLSGRGVGMDVVKTNLDRLGGKLEIHSETGAGSSFRIKLPLTLAIIPSLLVSAGEDRLAVPLINVQKLIRIDGADAASRIQCVGNARVLVLQDSLVPLVDLGRALDLMGNEAETSDDGRPHATNIVLLGGGAFRYGLVVERLHDTMEIVVKPLGRRLKHLQQYAGATILGDGCVALILDVAGVASVAGLVAEAAGARNAETAAAQSAESHQLLLVQNSAVETCALPLHVVARVEKIRPEQVEFVGGRRSMQYRGHSLPLVTLGDAARVAELKLDENLVVVVLEMSGRNIGLLAACPVDVVEADIEIDSSTLRQSGIMGSAIVRGRTTLILDAFELADTAWPGWNGDRKPAQETSTGGAVVLFAEDSAFFRDQTRKLLESSGYTILAAADGEEAWEILNERWREIQVVLTDVEMPRLDGLQLTRKIRGDRRVAHVPVIMLTSLAGEDDLKRGQMAGATSYSIKLDRDQLLETLHEALSEPGARKAAGNSAGLSHLSQHLSQMSDAALDGLAVVGERK